MFAAVEEEEQSQYRSDWNGYRGEFWNLPMFRPVIDIIAILISMINKSIAILNLRRDIAVIRSITYSYKFPFINYVIYKELIEC